MKSNTTATVAPSHFNDSLQLSSKGFKGIKEKGKKQRANKNEFFCATGKLPYKRKAVKQTPFFPWIVHFSDAFPSSLTPLL